MSVKNSNLLEALKNAPEGHGIYEEVERTRRNTGLSVGEINKILLPYTESILSENGLSDKEVSEIALKLTKQK